jgi:hypothetical protein
MIVIILNGYPGSGKDELIKMAHTQYKCIQHSTIDVCKHMALECGWLGEKDDKSRRMLSDLKKWYVDYFDGVYRDFTDTVLTYQRNTYYDFFFTVSREGKEIQRIRDWCVDYSIRCNYIFMDRDTKRDFGNDSDNNIDEDSIPNIYFNNKGDLDDLRTRTNDLLSDIIENKDGYFR